MKLDSVARNLRVLWRADAIIAQLQLQHMLTRFGLRAFAALIATFGLLGLELGAYFMLVQRLDAAPAAILLGAVNFVIAFVIVLASNRTRPSQDMPLALELHKSAVEALQADAAALQDNFASLSKFVSRPLDSALVSLAVPAVGLLINTLKKSKESKA